VEGKGRTENLPLVESEPPDQVAVLMVQHIGAPARPVVDKRDEVLKGQIIGQAQGYISANIHSPISGKVRKIENHTHGPTGKSVQAIVIKNDGEEKWAEGCNQPQDVDQMDAEQMIDLVQEAGVVGMGGATFPAHVKLSPPPETPVTDVIINGAECEPNLTCDHRLMLERSEEILDALHLMMRIVDADNGHVGIESNKPDAIQAFEQATASDPGITVWPLKVRYPQGAEQQLIEAITGREVPNEGGLPSDVRCLVHNVSTALAIRDAIRFRKPLIERPLTVTGDGVEEAGNFIERVGTSAEHILERQGVAEGTNLFIMGGPMMGVAQSHYDVPIIKGTSGLILRHVEKPPPQRACIRCGRCVEHCPLGLIPSELSIYCEKEEWDFAREADIMECKECGCCAYVCPAKRRIVHLTRYGKAEIAKQKRKPKE
jgi:electron transport complex protein RnfC